MIKKLIALPLLILLFVGGTVYAQTEDLPGPGILPDSPFYFLKNWIEGVGTFFTFGDVAKAQRFIHLAEVRLSEAKALVEKGKPEIVAKTIDNYQGQLGKALAKASEAKGKGHNVEEVLAKVSEATLKHQVVLAEVYEKVPEQAKQAIEKAMEVGIRGYEEALGAISGEKWEEIRGKVEEKRQQAEEKLEDLREKGASVPEIKKEPAKEKETTIGDRKFVLKNGAWHDSEVLDKYQEVEPVVLDWHSEEGQKILENYPELVELSVGEDVVLIFEGKVYSTEKK